MAEKGWPVGETRLPVFSNNRQHAEFITSFTADLKSDFFIENSGDALRRISKAGHEATRMTDRWEVRSPSPANSKLEQHITDLLLNASDRQARGGVLLDTARCPHQEP
jgi:hypothetical protein